MSGSGQFYGFGDGFVIAYGYGYAIFTENFGYRYGSNAHCTDDQFVFIRVFQDSAYGAFHGAVNPLVGKIAPVGNGAKAAGKYDTVEIPDVQFIQRLYITACDTGRLDKDHAAFFHFF